jgi:hypothetical protein
MSKKQRIEDLERRVSELERQAAERQVVRPITIFQPAQVSPTYPATNPYPGLPWTVTAGTMPPIWN